jgi:hypothetical protein
MISHITRYFICFFLLLLGLQETRAQATGELYLLVNPPSRILRLDTMKLDANGLYTLPVGQYVIRAWAPNYDLYIDTITITDTAQVRAVEHLDFHPNFLAHHEDWKDWRSKKFALTKLPLLTTITATVLSLSTSQLLYKGAEKNYDEALLAETNYLAQIDVDSISLWKEVYNTNRADYQRKIKMGNILRVSAVAIVATGVFLTVRLKKKSRSLVEPMYKETPLLSSVKLGLTSYGDQLCFSLKIPLR